MLFDGKMMPLLFFKERGLKFSHDKGFKILFNIWIFSPIFLQELLALEERMGSVSTALTEEAISECLKRSFYQPATSEDAAESCNENKDDIKCSICQVLPHNPC